MTLKKKKKTVKNFNLGFFIKKHHVEKAFLLIKLQIEQKAFTFRTIDLEIYRKEKSIENFDVDKFYSKYIEKDLFYNYRSLFYNQEYQIPKGAYGIRKFNFTSFYSIVLYYSLGFYFFELLKDSLLKIEPVKKNLKNFNTFYGGTIDFDKPEKSKIFYQNDYSNFNKGIKKSIQQGLKKKKKVCVIKLDIQDYFNSINDSLLLYIIDKYSLPSTKRRLHFDSTTKEAIISLFIFFNKKEFGLPLSAQNIFSNFISYIFLFELDNFIQCQKIYDKKGFSYFRYVDDFYLIFYENNSIGNDKIGKTIFEISTTISDFVTNDLSLKINHLKSQKWIIENDDNFKDFLTKEKFMSFADLYSLNIPNAKSPLERLINVCQIIESLKDEFKTKGKTDIDNDQDIALKEIFITSTKDYVKSKKAQKILNIAFEDWNPILTLNSLKALMFLIGNSKVGYNLVKKYLVKDFDIKIKKTQNLSLLEKFINLEQYDNSITKLVLDTKSKSFYFLLIQRMLKGKEDVIRKYLPIDDELLSENDSLMQQIKMLVLAEEEGKFNLAFNHLLNTFHLYCWIKDSSNVKFKDYNQNSVVIFLTNLKASIDEINFAISFFDRRNKNNISHPGDNLMENWVVNKEEYKEYYKKLISLIKRKIS